MLASAPLQTLSAAKEKAVALAAERNEDVTVKVLLGTYRLTETLTFTEEENLAKGDNTITFRGVGETAPIITGGIELKGWTRLSDGVYKTSVPETVTEVRQLYIDGEARQRAKSKYLYTAADYHYANEADRLSGKPDGIVIQDANFPAFSNPEEAELVYDILWTNQRVAVREVDYTDGACSVIMEQPYYGRALNKNYPGTAPVKGACFYIENALEFLDEAGEFYFDKTKKEIYYYPYENENPNTLSCQIPQTEFLLKNEGFDGLVLDRLDFRCGAWFAPNQTGVTGFQADALIGEALNDQGNNDASDMLPAQIQIKDAENVQIKNCSFSNMGSGAISLLGAARGSLIEGNSIRDVAGSGITVGDWRDEYAEAGVTAPCADNVIRNNLIKRTAQEYYGSVGIAVYYANGISIVNNDISDLPYTAISLGWGWGADKNPSGGHTVRYNRVTNACSVFSDGGLVYMLGSMPGTVVSDNYLTDCPGYGGIYFDQGSAGITVENNVLANCKNWLLGDTAELGAEGSEYVAPYYRVVRNNYADKADWAYRLSGAVTGNRDTTSTIQEAVLYDPAAPGGAVTSVIQNAGLGEGYKALADADGVVLGRENPLTALPKERFVPQDTKIINASAYSGFYLNNPNRTEPDVYHHGGTTVVGNIQWRDELEYTVHYDAPTEKKLLFRYASIGVADDVPDVEIFVNGVSIGSFCYETSASYQDFAVTNAGTVALEKENIIKFVFQSGVSFKELELTNHAHVKDTGFDDGSYSLPT